ncbi:MAG: hypothetical protein ABI333_00190 [bacterium]
MPSISLDPGGRACGPRWLTMALVAAAVVVAGCGQAVGAGDDAAVTTGDGDVDPVDAGPIVTGEPQWAMLGGTPQRNGRSAFVGPSQVTEQVVSLDAREDADVLVFVNAVGPDGTVYAVLRTNNELGRLVSLQPDGSVLWQGSIDVVGGVALSSAGHLLLEGAQRVDLTDPSSPVNTIFGLGSNGSVLWAAHPDGSQRIDTELRHSAPLVDSAGNVYVYLPIAGAPDLEHDGYHLCSFDDTGAFRWCWDRVVGSANYVAPALGPDETIYVAVENEDINLPWDPSSAEGVYALDLDGAEQWYLPLPSIRITTIAVGDDGTLYYAGFTAGVFVGSVDPAGGKGWTATFPQRYQNISTSLAIAPDTAPEPTVYVGGWHDPDADESEGSLTALTPAGVERWKVETGGIPCGGLAVDASGAVYALIFGSMMGASSPWLLSLEPDGSQRLSSELSPPHPPFPCLSTEVSRHTMSVVLADGGRIYLGSGNGKLHIFAP